LIILNGVLDQKMSFINIQFYDTVDLKCEKN